MEQWKELRYNTDYLISNKGNIVSLKYGAGAKRKKGSQPKKISTKHSSGYPILLGIKLIDGSSKSFRVNKLVIEHFDRDYDWDKYNVVNLDGDNYNCSIGNLSVQLKESYINKIHRVCENSIKRSIRNSGFKKCSKCKEYKNRLNFYWHKTHSNYMSECKDCKYKYSARYQKQWHKDKYNRDSFYRLKMNFRCRTTLAIKQKGYTKKSKTKKVLGCEWEFLKEHLENQFTKGMTWDNYGEWHVDHIIPISIAETEEQLYKLSHYTNLQPLWGVENISKNDKLPKDQIDKAKSLGLTIDYSKII